MQDMIKPCEFFVTSGRAVAEVGSSWFLIHKTAATQCQPSSPTVPRDPKVSAFSLSKNAGGIEVVNVLYILEFGRKRKPR